MEKHQMNVCNRIIIHGEEKWNAVTSKCHHIYVISAALVIAFIIAAGLLILEQPVCDPERGE